jgi:hypothetical protein
MMIKSLIRTALGLSKTLEEIHRFDLGTDL